MTRVIRAFVTAIAVSAVSISSLGDVSAQDPSASVTVTPADDATVGDPIEIRITVKHDPGDRVLQDGSLVRLRELEPAAPVVSEINERETLLTYTTRGFDTGSAELDLPPVQLQRADGALVELALGKIMITITSVLDDTSQPRPLSAPNVLAGGDRSYTPWIVALIGIAVGFLLARVARRWRRVTTAAVAAQPQAGQSHSRPPLAMDDSATATENCRQLAAAVRARLSDDWSLPATALTTSEIGPALAAAGASASVVLRATQLLESCDRVQYGGEEPTLERLRGYLSQAEAIWSDRASL